MKICPECGKKLEIVYSGRHDGTVFMCMNTKCKKFGEAFGKYETPEDRMVNHREVTLFSFG